MAAKDNVLGLFDKTDASVFITAGIGVMALTPSLAASNPLLLGVGLLLYGLGIIVWIAAKVKEL